MASPPPHQQAIKDLSSLLQTSQHFRPLEPIHQKKKSVDNYRDDRFAVGVGVPRLFVDLEAALGRQQAYEGGHLAG